MDVLSTKTKEYHLYKRFTKNLHIRTDTYLSNFTITLHGWRKFLIALYTEQYIWRQIKTNCRKNRRSQHYSRMDTKTTLSRRRFKPNSTPNQRKKDTSFILYEKFHRKIGKILRKYDIRKCFTKLWKQKVLLSETWKIKSEHSELNALNIVTEANLFLGASE